MTGQRKRPSDWTIDVRSGRLNWFITWDDNLPCAIAARWGGVACSTLSARYSITRHFPTRSYWTP